MLMVFKDRWAHVWFKLGITVGWQEYLIEQFGVRNPGIQLASLGTVAGLSREAGNGDFPPDFERHVKVFRNLIWEMSKLIRGRWAVEGGIIPDRAKERFAVVEVLTVLP